MEHMSAEKYEDNPHGYILIDATKHGEKQKRKKGANSKQSANKKQQAKTLHCALCGLKIPSGGLLKHKEIAHGEKVVPRHAQTECQKSLWIKLVQGGLPSLGKRK
jgi:hypothetical protein